MAIANGVCEEHDKKIGSKTALDRATGNFEIRVEDDALRRKFESIRKTIREGHDGK